MPISRICWDTARPASALPILSAVQFRPDGDSARAPAARQRDANGMSEVTQTSALVMRSAIQSSATSAPAATVTMRIFGLAGGRMGRDPFDTTCTTSPSRSATR